MAALFAYSMAVSLVLIPLYLTIRLCMAGLTFHRLTRAMLLLSLLVSVTLPFAAEPLRHLIDTATNPSATGVIEIGGAISMAAVPEVTPSTPLWLRTLLVVYILGLVFFTVRECWAVARLVRIIRQSRPERNYGRWQIRVTSENGLGPFSFGRYIIINESDLATLQSTILTHESMHLAARHWIDLLLADTVSIICWYCPAAWLTRRDLASVHEYEADEAVIASGADAAEYQIMLIKKAAGHRFPSIACNLTFKSTISKRVKMMLKPKSRPALRLLAALALPAVGLSLLALSAPNVANALEAVSGAKVTNNSPAEQIAVAPAAVQADDTTAAAQTAAASDKKKEEVVEYGTRKKTDLDEIVVVGHDATAGDGGPLIVIDGKVQESSAAFKSLDANQVKSITVLKNEEAKAKYGSYPAAGNGVILVQTKEAKPAATQEMTEEAVINSAADEQKGADKVLDAVEQPPQYPGGISAMMKFIADNIRFPQSAVKDTTFTGGRAIVRFVVEKNGTVGKDIQVIRSAGNKACDEEAKRVAALMKFTPGMTAGKPVRVEYTLPITFKK